MSEDYCCILLKNFLKNSWSPIKVLVEKLAASKQEKSSRQVQFFSVENGKKTFSTFDGNHFFLRGSVEYSNPQLTLEEVQGIIGTRLLEACGNYFDKTGLLEPDRGEICQMCEQLKKPPEGTVVPFLLNTDDVEADRYSMNPLRASLVESGQSAFPAASVKTDQLKVDLDFLEKYDGKLISKKETNLMDELLKNSNGSYLDFVDSVKYAQLDELSKVLGMDLKLPSLRMPITSMQAENKNGLIHYIISQSHQNYQSVQRAYTCMNRSMSNRTTLLTIPHSKLGFGSKRAARGKIHFEGEKLRDVTVTYKTTQLYPNDIDPQDIAVAKAEDNFTVIGEKLADYTFNETPSSPQFFLYMLASPENAAVWHGVGESASSQLLQSLSSARNACKQGKLIDGLGEKYGVKLEVPLQFNLVPSGMWSHPVHRNIDASIGCVDNIADLVGRGMLIEHLSNFK